MTQSKVVVGKWSERVAASEEVTVCVCVCERERDSVERSTTAWGHPRQWSGWASLVGREWKDRVVV